MTQPPTPLSTLNSLCEIAAKYLKYVYAGNTNDDERQHTYCPECGNLLIKRTGYKVDIEGLTTSGSCNSCGFELKLKG